MHGSFFSFVLLLSLFFQLHFVHAQRDKVDSLHLVLDQHVDVNNSLQDTITIRIHNSLSWEYYRLSSYDTATYYAERSLELLEPLPTNHPTVKELRASALNNLGNSLTEHATYDSALQIFRQALALWEQLEDERGMAHVYNNMEIIYDYRGQFDKSVEQYSQALALRRAIHDTVGVADAYNNLGVVYHYQGLYLQALENYLAALERYQQAGDLDVVAYIYNNVGLVYQRQEQSDDALASFEDALQIRLEMNISHREIGSTYANIVSIYMEKAEYETALRYDSLALGIFEEINDQYRIASTVTNEVISTF